MTRKIRSIISVFFCLALAVLSLSACGGGGYSAPPAPNPIIEKADPKETDIVVTANPVELTYIEKADPKETDIVVTANPVELTYIARISKFRSGAGHWFAGTNFYGEPEPSSSMKHYFQAVQSLWKTSGQKIRVFSPFDGTICHVDREDVRRGRQFYIKTKPYSGWIFGFTHIDMEAGLEAGSEVKAGQFLGYANLSDGSCFDVQLQRFRTASEFRGIQEDYTRNLEPLFPHMTAELLAVYRARGITPENTFISKQEREKAPYPCASGQPGTTFCTFDTPMDSPADWVTLK